jgi:hypothetical protein
MPSQAIWLLALIGAFLLGGVVQPASAQEKKKTSMVVRYVAHLDDGKHRYQGKPVMLLQLEPLTGGRPVELVVPNRDMGARSDKFDPVPQVADVVRGLKKGDTIKIELDDSKPRPFVTYAKPYKLKPGEAEPNTYVFENTFRKEEGRSTYTAVVLSRFDEQTTFAVQQRRDKDGDMASDVTILNLLQKLKTGELVEAEIKEGGRTPVLTSLERYAPPQQAKFVKMAEQEVEGQKAPAVELQRDGKPVTALVEGKMQGKRWVADAKVLSAAKRLKPDAEVVFRARDDDGKLWLKEIEPAPKPAEERTESSARGGRATASRDAAAKNTNEAKDGERKADK